MDDLKDLYEKRVALKIKGHNFLSKELRTLNRKIKATEEGVRDILTTNAATLSQSLTSVVDKNNYKTYAKKVQGAYEMYSDSCDYGGEIFGGVVDARVSFIGGEGLSIVSKNENTKKWLNKIIKDNHLDGSRFVDTIRTGELEGRNLLTLKSDKAFKAGVKIRSFRYADYKYKIFSKGYDKDIVEKVVYNEGASETELKEDFVLVRVGGTWNDPNNTPSKSMKILTDCENFSRAKYDFRKNNHLFGRTTPWVRTEDEQTARNFTDAVSSGDWKIGDGYAGPAELSLVAPGSDSSKVITDEITLMVRVISAMTGIPIHWLAWPDLMSNRATAENLMEAVKAATQMERLIWEEAFEELLYKALIMSVDAGKAPNAAIDDFEVRLPFISIAEIKAIVGALGGLVDKRYVSIETLQSKIPGIDPAIEKDRLAIQQEEKVQQQVNENEMLGNSQQNNQQNNFANNQK
jgi:hypothetical protein